MKDWSHEIVHEIEIKLNLETFINYLKLIGFLGRVEHEERQISAFFDTEDRKLADLGWALRARVESSRGTITVKDIGKEVGAAVIRQEIESEIPRAEAVEILNLRTDIMNLDILPIECITQKAGAISVAKLVQFENVRQKKLFKIDDDNYILEIDKTEFNDGSVDYEVELELTDPDHIEVVEDGLKKLFSSLEIPYQRQSESKFARAMRRAKIY